MTEPDATTVAVAASSIPGEFLVPGLVERFAAEQPEFRVATEVTDSAGVFAALRDGRADVGFSGVEPDDDDLVAEAVAAGEGVGVVSAWALERHGRDDVREVRVEGDPVSRCLYLVLRRDDDLTPAATTFLTLVREQART